MLVLCVYAQDEPTLPAGLGGQETESDEPALPEGLGTLPFDLTGFMEVRSGWRLQDDPYEKSASIGEARIQIEIEKNWPIATLNVTADFLADPVLARHKVRLQEGQGRLDLRQACLVMSPSDSIDLKVGRQILTWGTGDMLFINDLFPKDWNSFFIGRDDEYLKAPSDSLKASIYTSAINLDIIYTPLFDPDRFIDGKRISFWNGMLGRRSGKDVPVEDERRDDWFADDEVAMRLFKNIGGYEFSVYAYNGFWKSPGGTDSVSGEVVFPPLSVYGASVRSGVYKGIGNAEIGYYDSRSDRGGDDPFVKNSEFRALLGYEQELVKELTLGLQYYIESMAEYDAYKRTLPAGSRDADENRHVFTVRLTKLMMNQNLILSLFGYYSPSDEDAYLKPKVHYKVTDNWAAEAGGNIFLGEDDHTFFGQFEKNTNAYFSLRYSF